MYLHDALRREAVEPYLRYTRHTAGSLLGVSKQIPRASPPPPNPPLALRWPYVYVVSPYLPREPSTLTRLKPLLWSAEARDDARRLPCGSADCTALRDADDALTRTAGCAWLAPGGEEPAGLKTARPSADFGGDREPWPVGTKLRAHAGTIGRQAACDTVEPTRNR